MAVVLGLVRLMAARQAVALEVVGYAAAVNDRFTAGYPSAPLTNAGSAFVGRSFSWLGVGWADSDPTKGFGFITPRHYLVARHYGGAATIRVLAADGTLATGTQAAVTDTGFGVQLVPGQTVGDLSIGTLTAALSSTLGLPRYAVLDLNPTSATSASYAGLPVFLSGRGPDAAQSPRIAQATVSLSGSITAGFQTSQAAAAIETGDSGSPDFIPWTNPDGQPELTIIGNNAARGGTARNLCNFLGLAPVMEAVGAITGANGYTLRIVGTPTHTWSGTRGASIGDPVAWGLSPSQTAPADQYVMFSATAGGQGRTVRVDTAADLRGVFFTTTGSDALGFTLSGTSPLTIGRGGVTNYDTSRQSISAPIVLGASQCWSVGPGGVTVAAVHTGTGFLVEVDGSGTARFAGSISGGGGVALSGRQLELSGSNSHTGGTWVHHGTLVLDHASAARSSGVTVATEGTLAVGGILEATVARLDLAPGGLVDVGRGGITVTAGLPVPGLVAALVAGRAGGSWTGPSGITSSVAAAEVAASVPRAVGWVDNGDGSLSVAYAAPGDTNIDWSIDILDASNFLAGGKFDTGAVATWIEGDFSYDGVVDILDAADFFATGLYDAGNYNAGDSAAGVAAVPEPAASSLMTLAGALVLRRPGRRGCGSRRSLGSPQGDTPADLRNRRRGSPRPCPRVDRPQ